MARIHTVGEAVRLKPNETATIVLTMEEAQVIADCMHRIGGNPRETRRCIADHLVKVFREAGIMAGGTNAKDILGTINAGLQEWDDAAEYQKGLQEK